MENEKSFTDPIDEIYAIRQRISARYGHDPLRLSEAMIEHQRISAARGRKVVRFAETRPPSLPEGIDVLVACEPAP